MPESSPSRAVAHGRAATAPAAAPAIPLAAKHDFAAKLRHPELLDRVKAYVRSQVDARSGRAVDLPDAAPVSINLDLTTGCNYACDHCVDKDILNQPFRFDHERLLDSLRVLAERGLRSVIVIGGGEPTTYRLFPEVIRHVKALGLRVAIVSNGSGQAKIAEVAGALGPEDWVRLSLDAGTDATFQAMHKPKRPITLDEICSAVPGIKRANDRFQFGFSFIITWRGATIHDTEIVENLDEMVPAAELARRSGFDYVSFKPFLTRAPENNAEIVGVAGTETAFAQVLRRIRRHVDEARRLETPRFRVVESTNLRVLESGDDASFRRQPRQCHMQFFRQVLSPLGLYNCPVYRNQPHGRIHDKDGYATPERLRESLASTAALLRGFDASRECREVTCLYNPVNAWLEDLIRRPEGLETLEPEAGREPDFFL